jgi:hypothetical protein
MTTLFLISYVGPEWSKAIEAWEDRELAKKRVQELDKTLDKTDIFDGLSSHQINEIPLRKE